MSLLDSFRDAAKASPVTFYPLLVISLFVVYNVAGLIYNLFFHPLRHFPGPVLHRASKIPWALANIRGEKPFLYQKLHEKYGPVVRVAPDFLDFTDARAWKDIFGHRTGAQANAPEMPKAPVFYNATGEPNNLVNADPEEHARLRRALANGFSAKALRDQEAMIGRHVDHLLELLHERCENGKVPLEMDQWFAWTSFDVIGELVLGQDFRSLERGERSGLFKLVLDTVTAIAFLGSLKYLGLDFVVQILTKLGGANEAYDAVLEDIGERLKKRMASQDERPDLIEGLIRPQGGWELSFPKLRSNAMLLCVAGSETTATSLSGATYLLLTHPDKLARLQDEVRSKFKNPGEITMASVSSLEYMLAVINESMRCYPPVAGGIVRLVPPKKGAQIAGHFIPGNTLVEINNWSANKSSLNWTDAEAFLPERFLTKGETRDVFDSLQPFSYGPRNCIGQNLAIAEIRLILARIIFSFDMKLGEGTERWFERQVAHSIWLKPALPVYLTPRKNF